VTATKQKQNRGQNQNENQNKNGMTMSAGGAPAATMMAGGASGPATGGNRSAARGETAQADHGDPQ
jgi:hypothetical protein